MKYNVVLERLRGEEVIERKEIHNAVNTDGVNELLNWIINYNADGGRGFDSIEFLDGTTSLGIYSDSVSYTLGNTYYSVTAEYTASGSKTIDNLKLRDNTHNHVLATTSFSAYNLNDEEKLKVTWTISFSWGVGNEC